MVNHLSQFDVCINHFVCAVASQWVVRVASPVNANDVSPRFGRANNKRHYVTKGFAIEVVRHLAEDNKVKRVVRLRLRNRSLLHHDVPMLFESASRSSKG